MDSGSGSKPQESGHPPGARPQGPPPTSEASLGRSLERLAEAAPRLAALPARDRARLLRSVLSRFHELSERIVELDCLAKDIPRDGPRAGEPMFDGPAIVLRYASELADTLERKSALAPESVRNEGGRTVVDVLPRNGYERLLFPFWRGEARLDRELAWDAVATPPHELMSDHGTVALVLGAGNVTSIGVVDALQQCFALGRACVYKVSPVNDYLAPLLELAFAPLVKEGWFAFAYGGRDVGERLVADPAVDAVHVTGALETFESIVWGPHEGRAERKARGEPVLRKPVTAELGNISPVVVVPSAYDEREIEHAARSIVGTFTFNAAFNCNATKLVVTAHGWPQREALLARIRHHLERVSPRLAYYPGAEEKYRRFSRAGGRLQSFGAASDGVLPWAFVTDLDASKNEEVFRDEPFCAVLSEVTLPGSDALEFLPEATLFLNHRVWGTLNAMMIAPKSVEDDRATAAALEQAISALRYGSVCVNVWPAAAYGLGTLPWGGHPTGTLADVQSGLGWGHNALLLRHVEKTVLYAPLVQVPKPLWYPDHRTLPSLAREFADFAADPGPWKLTRLAATALRG